jgi:hypothetical protein
MAGMLFAARAPQFLAWYPIETVSSSYTGLCSQLLVDKQEARQGLLGSSSGHPSRG